MVPRLSVLLPVLLPLAPPLRRRRRLFAAAVALVVSLHGLALLALAPSSIDAPEPVVVAPVLDVRSLVLPAPPLPAPAPVAQPPAPPLAPQQRRLAAVPTVVPAPPAASAAPSPPAPRPAAGVDAFDAAAAHAAPEPAPQAHATAIGPTAVATLEVPVYATRLPPAGSWRYELQRGLASGHAQLSWQPDAQGRYEARLQGWVAGVTVVDWVSTGALDSAGIAPERFAIRRRGKDNQAANFQRDAGKVTFSGPTHEVPLLAGVQDRLSWMLQLPAVIEADPQRFYAGASVSLMVIGARGGADVWTFKVVGTERLGEVDALRLLREARKPHDVQVDVWLDPAHGHIPLRAVLAQPEGGTPLELRWQPGSTGS
jgi:hypothetical protein